jgi:hypothetical protein
MANKLLVGSFRMSLKSVLYCSVYSGFRTCGLDACSLFHFSRTIKNFGYGSPIQSTHCLPQDGLFNTVASTRSLSSTACGSTCAAIKAFRYLVFTKAVMSTNKDPKMSLWSVAFSWSDTTSSPLPDLTALSGLQSHA